MVYDNGSSYPPWSRIPGLMRCVKRLELILTVLSRTWKLELISTIWRPNTE